jgi:alpha-L-rhamnosidase
MQQLQPADIADAELSRIDAIAVNTLKNCMQRVFEDGPKRDRRLWIGDLRLEALANHYTFGNAALVRRCLYLFAASDRNQYGIMPGFVYENPIFCSGDWYMADYSLMFICTLCDLYTHTGDIATFDDLYPIACEILDVLDATKNEQGLVTSQSGDFFIDWCDGLNRCAASQGVYLYTLDIWCAALEAMGRAEQAAPYRRRLLEGRAAAVQTQVQSAPDLQAPVHAGQVVGSVRVTLDGELLADIPLRAVREIPAMDWAAAMYRLLAALLC